MFGDSDSDRADSVDGDMNLPNIKFPFWIEFKLWDQSNDPIPLRMPDYDVVLNYSIEEDLEQEAFISSTLHISEVLAKGVNILPLLSDDMIDRMKEGMLKELIAWKVPLEKHYRDEDFEQYRG